MLTCSDFSTKIESFNNLECRIQGRNIASQDAVRVIATEETTTILYTQHEHHDSSSCLEVSRDAFRSQRFSSSSDLEAFLQTPAACRKGGRASSAVDTTEWLNQSTGCIYQSPRTMSPLLASTSSLEERSAPKSCGFSNNRMLCWKRSYIRQRRRENQMTLLSPSSSLDQTIQRSSVSLRSLPRDLEMQRLEDDKQEEQKSRLLVKDTKEVCCTSSCITTASRKRDDEGLDALKGGFWHILSTELSSLNEWDHGR